MTVGDTTPVGRYPDGKSPYGLLDVAGNVWEWTSSLWGKDVNKPDFGYPYDPKDGRENQNAPDTVLRAFRGGSFRDGARSVRCAFRDRYYPGQPVRPHWFSGGVPRLLKSLDSGIFGLWRPLGLCAPVGALLGEGGLGGAQRPPGSGVWVGT